MPFNTKESSLRIIGGLKPGYESLLTPAAQAFLIKLHECFEGRRQELLLRRKRVQSDIDSGILPNFLPETKFIREDNSWRGANIAPGLEDRRVEITGPVSRKMIINALNSEATQFMADFEDSTSPTWTNIMDGHVNLLDANKRQISFVDPSSQRSYQLKKEQLAVLLVRPRGWHLDEVHVLINGSPISASLFDFGLYFYHNAKLTTRNGHGLYFYLPKLESHLEARLWNDVFILAQEMLALPVGTIRATALIETILAVFEMDEIIYELKEHSAGLNCGRWDYIFSFIKKFYKHSKFILPDRSNVTMTVPFMKAYVELLVWTCHRRGIHAMGGMAAQIPIKNDPVANNLSMKKVREDKEREVSSGHDGTWVAHPDLIPIAKEVFTLGMKNSHQINFSGSPLPVSQSDLLNPDVPGGHITKTGVVDNVKASLQYISSWLSGTGCVPINNLMEDAATAEISRSQLWQWINYSCSTFDSKEKIDLVMIDKICSEIVVNNDMYRAQLILKKLVGSENFEEFLTSFCYRDIVNVSLSSKI